MSYVGAQDCSPSTVTFGLLGEEGAHRHVTEGTGTAACVHRTFLQGLGYLELYCHFFGCCLMGKLGVDICPSSFQSDLRFGRAESGSSLSQSLPVCSIGS